MSEEDSFNNLLNQKLLQNSNDKIDPMYSNVDRKYKIPGWVFGVQEDYMYIKYKLLNRKLYSVGITPQILYDIGVLGLKNTKDRPKCSCGKYCKFGRSFNDGYRKTCGDKNCIEASIKNTITKQWKNSEYANHMKNAHRIWASLPENKKKLSENTKSFWKNSNYRTKQIESHRKFIENNPDKIFTNKSGYYLSLKWFSKIYYNSLWERDFIYFCDNYDEVTYLQRANLSIPYEFENGTHYYFPDFKVQLSNGNTVLVEIKSDWLLKHYEKTALKLKAGENYVNSHSLDFSKYAVYFGKDLYSNIDKRVLRSFQSIFNNLL